MKIEVEVQDVTDSLILKVEQCTFDSDDFTGDFCAAMDGSPVVRIERNGNKHIYLIQTRDIIDALVKMEDEDE